MEIYLTKMILNPRCPKVRRDLGNQQELHRTISSAFPPIANAPGLKEHEKRKPRGEYNLLHRLDIDERDSTAKLIVQSCVEPNWDGLVGDYGTEIECKPVHNQYAAIKDGMHLVFRLLANPTRRIGDRDTRADDRFKRTAARSGPRRRVEITGDDNETRDEKLIKWLKRKGEVSVLKCEKTHADVKVGGFAIVRVEVKESIPNVTSAFLGKARFTKVDNNDDRRKHRVTLDAICFDGVLKVTDAKAFYNTLSNGIGTGKAYGFGLLSIAPVRAAGV